MRPLNDFPLWHGGCCCYRARKLTDQKKRAGNIDKGRAIMTIKRAEFLVLVALVTSAAVVQLRERTLDVAPQQTTTHATSCAVVRQGIAPASCEVKRDERRVDSTAHRRHDETRIRV